jgi:uncharacterized protein
MKNAILIHGRPDRDEEPPFAEKHWFPWIKRKLEDLGFSVVMQDMPDAKDPNYSKWKEAFEKYPVNPDTTLVGHSCGGGFLVRWLSENKVKVGKVVLVAPWLDPEGEIDKEFFDFEIDPGIAERTEGLNIIYSTDDFSDIIESINILKSRLVGAEFQEFTDKGHFTLEDMGTEEFPELLASLI